MSEVPKFRTSERKDFKRCQQRWWWSWREGLRAKGLSAPPLWFGTGIHLALALWYCGPGKKRGPHPAETWQAYCGSELEYMRTQRLTDEQEVYYIDAQELGTVMMNGYVEKYGRDEHKLIIQPEQTFSILIPWTDRQAVYEVADRMVAMAEYVGTYDGVWRDYNSGQLWLDEHKTAKAIFTKHLSMDDQGGGYWATAARALAKQGLITQGEPLRGIEYNFLRKALPDDRPKNADGYYTNLPTKAHFVAALSSAGLVSLNGKGLDKWPLAALKAEAEKEGLVVLGEVSKTQESPLFHREKVHRTSAERNQQLLRIQNEAVQMQVFRDGLLPLTKTPTRDCSWDCSHFSMCELQDRGGNWEDFKELNYNVADPYADHRKSTDE